VWHESTDGIEHKHIKILVIEINQSHHFQITSMFVSHNHTPVQWHLYVVIANAYVCTGSAEYVQEHQRWPIIVHTVGIAVVQNTISEIISSIWQLIQVKAGVLRSEYVHSVLNG
jgi:hypothetical protein